MAKLIEDNGYDYVIFGGGLLGFEIGAGLAARLHGGVTMEVTEVKAQDGKLVAVRPILQDSAVVDVGYSDDGPAVIIGRLNAFEIAGVRRRRRRGRGDQASTCPTGPPRRRWSSAASSAART